MKKNSLKLILVIILFSVFLGNFCYAKNLLELPEKPAGTTIALPAYLKWVFDFGIAIGFFSLVLALIISGSLYIFSNAMPSLRSKAKEWLSGAFTGFLILVFLYLIIITIYPSMAVFSSSPVIKLEPFSPSKGTLHGLYLYESTSCKENPIPIPGGSSNISFVSKSHLFGAELKQDYDRDVYYVGLLYDSIDFYGQCQYLNPNTGCQDIKLATPASVSVYRYSKAPKGDVVIYRKGAGGAGGFSKKGGYLIISAASIGGLYEEELKSLSFTGKNIGSTNISDCTVPPEEQDCAMWDKKAKCIQKKCPTLDKRNIGSINIEGNYWVILGYNWKQQGDTWVADFCQSYPKVKEVNKIGPKQVKWDAIYTHLNYYPQTITIVPVEEK